MFDAIGPVPPAMSLVRNRAFENLLANLVADELVVVYPEAQDSMVCVAAERDSAAVGSCFESIDQHITEDPAQQQGVGVKVSGPGFGQLDLFPFGSLMPLHCLEHDFHKIQGLEWFCFDYEFIVGSLLEHAHGDDLVDRILGGSFKQCADLILVFEIPIFHDAEEALDA